MWCRKRHQNGRSEPTERGIEAGEGKGRDGKGREETEDRKLQTTTAFIDGTYQNCKKS